MSRLVISTFRAFRFERSVLAHVTVVPLCGTRGIMQGLLCYADRDADYNTVLQSADFARQADEVMYEERDRLRTSLLSSVTVLQIQHALGIFSNWLQVCADDAAGRHGQRYTKTDRATVVRQSTAMPAATILVIPGRQCGATALAWRLL